MFCPSKITSFLKNEVNDLACASRNQNICGHSSRYITEGGAKMLIRCFRNNDTRSISKTLVRKRNVSEHQTQKLQD